MAASAHIRARPRLRHRLDMPRLYVNGPPSARFHEAGRGHAIQVGRFESFNEILKNENRWPDSLQPAICSTASMWCGEGDLFVWRHTKWKRPLLLPQFHPD